MSLENVEKVSASIDAYNRRDFDAALRDIDADVTFELTQFAAGATAPVHRGRAGVRRFWNEIEEHFDGYRLEPSGWRDSGDVVYCEVMMMGTGKGSGAPIELLTYNVTELSDGRIARVRYFIDESEALEAAGLSE